MSRDMFLQSEFQFGFLPSKLCLFPLKSSLEFVLHRGKPKFISFPVKFPADRSKFQFYTMARSKPLIIFPRTVLPCLCFFFLNPAAEIMIHMLFNTLFKVTPHNRQKRRKRKERIKLGPSRRCSRWVTHPVPNPARQGLTWGALLKNRVSRELLRDTYFKFMLRCCTWIIFGVEIVHFQQVF